MQEQIQYISNEQGEVTGVIVPIDVWNGLSSEKETQYLLSSDTMKKRLLEAKNRDYGISLEEACEKNLF